MNVMSSSVSFFCFAVICFVVVALAFVGFYDDVVVVVSYTIQFLHLLFITHLERGKV